MIEEGSLFWKNKSFDPVSSETVPLTLLSSPYFPNTFTPSIGAGILDYKVEKIIADSYWREKFSGEKFFVKGLNFRAFDMASVAYSSDRLSLFYTIACFAINNPDKIMLTKSDLIRDTFEYLVNWLGLRPQNIVVSVFSGGYIGNEFFEGDEETKKIWQSLGIPSENIVNTSTQLNYLMSMSEQYGNSGLLPFMGPRSEVYYLHETKSKRNLIEIATLQYIHGQRDKKENKLIRNIPEIYSVAFGLERIAMILSSAESIFDIDILKPLKEVIYEFLENKIEGTNVNIFKTLINPEVQIIVDHIRAYFFLMAHTLSGQLEMSEGRKSTLNKLKREINSVCNRLGIDIKNILPRLVDKILEIYNSINPELHNIEPGKIIKYFLEGKIV